MIDEKKNISSAQSYVNFFLSFLKCLFFLSEILQGFTSSCL